MPEDGWNESGMWLEDGTFVPWNDVELSEDGTIEVGDLFMTPESTGSGVINPNPNSPKELIDSMSLTNKILSLGALWIVLSTKPWK